MTSKTVSTNLALLTPRCFFVLSATVAGMLNDTKSLLNEYICMMKGKNGARCLDPP